MKSSTDNNKKFVSNYFIAFGIVTGIGPLSGYNTIEGGQLDEFWKLEGKYFELLPNWRKFRIGKHHLN